MTEPAITFIEMPPLPDFSHAVLENVTVGPRRAVTLTLTPLLWVGTAGLRDQTVTVRLGGVANLEVAATFFAVQHVPAELAKLRYAAWHTSRPGDLFIELIFERVEAQLMLQCHSITMTEGAVSR